MPGLLNGRVCNARFNGGKQYYDDLQISSNNDAVVIDMVNGGGKSFLIQCLGQTIIPNSRWQNDWEFKAVFEPKNKNTVIHCMTEWRLDDGMEYKYLLAGFCASKPTRVNSDDENYSYGNFERISYICLYNEPNENDIFNFPLKQQDDDGKDRFMTLPELKRYLSSIKSRDYYTEIAPSSIAYRKRLSQYNIIEPEWDLIKGVNADEKYVATYLRQYPTSEKFILDFLIPKIEKCNSTRAGYDYQDSDSLATALMDIKEQLGELMRNKAQSGEYNKIIEFIEVLSNKLSDIGEQYEKREELYVEIKKTIKFLEDQAKELKAKHETTLSEIATYNKKIENQDLDIQGINTIALEWEFQKKNDDKDKKEKEIHDLEKTLEDEKRNCLIKKMENVYHSILLDEAKVEECLARIKTLEISNKDLIKEREELGVKVKGYLLSKAQDIEAEKNENISAIEELSDDIDECNSNISYKNSEVLSLEKDNCKIKSFLSDLNNKLTSTEFNKIAAFEKNSDSLVFIESVIEENTVLQKESLDKIGFIEKDIKNAENNINSLEKDIIRLEYVYRDDSDRLALANELYSKIETLYDIYGSTDVKPLYETIKTKLESLEDINGDIIKDISETKVILSSLKNRNISVSEDTIKVFDILRKKYSGAILGTEFISNLSIDDKKYFIDMNSLIPYSILLDEKDYSKFISDKELLENYYGSAIPIINKKTLDDVIMYPNGITFTSKGVDFFVNEDKISKLRDDMESKLEKLKISKEENEREISRIREEVDLIKRFIDNFGSVANMESLAAGVRNVENSINKNKEDIEEYESIIVSLKSDALQLTNNVTTYAERIKDSKEQLNLLREYIMIVDSIAAREKDYKSNIANLESIKNDIQEEESFLQELKIRRAEEEALKSSIQEKKIRLDVKLDTLNYIELSSVDILNKITDDEYVLLDSKLNAINKKLQGATGNLSLLEEEISSCRGRISDNKSTIEQEGFSLGGFKYISIDFIKNTRELIDDLTEYIRKIDALIDDKNKELYQLINECGTIEGKLISSKEKIYESHGVDFDEIRKNIERIVDCNTYKNKLSEIKKSKKDNEQRRRALKHEEDKLKDEINKNKDIKNEFLVLNKDADIDITGEDLVSIRDSRVVKESLQDVEKTIKYRENSYKKQINKGHSIVTYVHGFKEILNELEKLPNVSFKIKEIACKLTGDSEDSWINMLRAEQQKIDENIKSLELQEEKFITLCIQKSENVLRDVKKLSDLSVIEIKGERQEMLRINLNKLPDDIARERMKNYIENLIKACADEENDNDRKLKLSKGLTTDNLFKQIIEKIRPKSVELYKLEDIENKNVNEWLTLDRAYGSKGQTNGMYVSMLICIISYLRKLYTSSVDDSKKVLILDNPFSGTTSEIIWLPILKLLRENNVQLWAVGFEIKTQLANSFPTRYYLEKKVTNKYEKIVVADFKSTYDLNKLEYNPLSGQQMGLQLE